MAIAFVHQYLAEQPADDAASRERSATPRDTAIA
jgi:hypothetical protein